MDNLFLLQGDDDFAKTEFINEIKLRFNKLEKGINFIQFDKDNIGGLENELETYSFFSEEKLIIVRVPINKRKSAISDEDEEEIEEKNTIKDWYTESLEEHIKNKVESTTLVFVESGTAKSKLFKFISSNGSVIIFDKAKPNEIVNFTINYAKKNNLNLQKVNATYLAEICGNNKQIIANEIDKFLDYVGDGNEIRKDDIDLMCAKTPEVIIFELTDSMGDRNKSKSLKVLDNLLDSKEPIQKIAIMLAKHFKNLMIAKFCKEQGKNVAVELNVSPYPASKYTNQANNFSKEELISIFKSFAELDLNSKIGNIDLKVGLQRIILT